MNIQSSLSFSSSSFFFLNFLFGECKSFHFRERGGAEEEEEEEEEEEQVKVRKQLIDQTRQAGIFEDETQGRGFGAWLFIL